ncbi:MAG TPA: hypothetical protein VFQ39_20610, partial [Longimicrobium sp.]|nr:hypothetical protein [Longimicrobium sp.]
MRRVRRSPRRIRRRAAVEGARAARGWGALVEWFNGMQLSENAILLGFAVAIGVAAALGVIVFYRSIDLSYTLFYRWTGRVLGRDVLAFYRPLITAAGVTAAW